MKKNQYRQLEWQDVHYLRYDFNIYIRNANKHSTDKT